MKENNRPGLGRRGFLTGLGIVGATAVTSVGFAAPAVASQTAAPTTQWLATTSENGWPVQVGNGEPNTIAAHKVEGANTAVVVLSGKVATVLLHVARRFHYEIATLHAGDVHGHTTDRAVAAAFESNHLSGTAIAIRPDLYPTGARGGLFPHEEMIVRDILAECQGVVRWGGDDRKMPKESHFQIDVPPGDARLARLAARIGVSKEVGAPADPFAAERLRVAGELAQRQKATAK